MYFCLECLFRNGFIEKNHAVIHYWEEQDRGVASSCLVSVFCLWGFREAFAPWHLGLGLLLEEGHSTAQWAWKVPMENQFQICSYWRWGCNGFAVACYLIFSYQVTGLEWTGLSTSVECMHTEGVEQAQPLSWAGETMLPSITWPLGGVLCKKLYAL